MLPGRQQARRAWLLALLLLSVASGAAAGAGANVGSAGTATTTPDVAVDWRTGLAIYGIDPVAYFYDHKATEGLPEFELRRDGAVWRFRNEGNRAAFAANPDVYMPRFGGNDATALVRGVTLAGSPLIWTLFGQRLYLFHSSAARAAFVADPQAMIARADAQAHKLASAFER